MARTLTGAHVSLSTRGFDNLTATSYAADITTDPPTARGSADLLVDGHRSPTDFRVEGGHLFIRNADGTKTSGLPADPWTRPRSWTTVMAWPRCWSR